MQSLNFKNTVNICGGKVDVAKEMVQMMLNDLPVQKALLEEAYQQENWETLEHLAHKLAGSAAYCAMEELHYTAKQLCTTLREKQLQEVAQNYKSLQNSIREASLIIVNDLHI